MKTRYSIFFLLLFPLGLWAQIDSLGLSYDDADVDGLPPEIREIMEDYLTNLEESSDLDPTEILDNFSNFYSNPLDLNKATEDDLRDLYILSNIQIQQLLDHRSKFGNLVSLLELQSIPAFDINTIRIIQPLVRVKGDLDDYNVPVWEMMYKGKNTIYTRFDRVLEKKKGFIEQEDGTTAYLGDRNRYIVRLRHQYENRLSYGLTMEKDAGEEFFTGSNKRMPGFDFWSAHFFMKDINKWLKGFALGDYAVNMGQGLIMFDGFGSGKGSFVTDVKKGGRALRPYTSIGEFQYKRGAGITIGLGDMVEVTGFASYKAVDANISSILISGDSTDLETEVLQVSSLQTSGLHRTEAEIFDKHAINQLTTGGIVKFKGAGWHVAGNFLYNKFGSELDRTYQPYNQFTFNGDQLINGSLDYSFVYRNFNFFGETAMSDNGGLATINGLIMTPDKHVDLAIIYRNYQKEYQTLTPNVFGETSQGANEQGLYLGLKVKPNKHWIFSGYFDAWKHPWMRFVTDGPSTGAEYFARITYKRKRKMRAYIQFRDEFKERNLPENENNHDFLVDTRKTYLRFHIDNKVTKALELRNRAEFSWFDDGSGMNYNGYMLLQDVIYKPIGFPLHITGRFALFDVNDSDARIYAYENDILYSFAIPGYNNKGTRFYINLRYRGIRNMTLELRFAQTYYSDQDTFGSGNELIDGNTRSEIKAQVKYKF